MSHDEFRMSYRKFSSLYLDEEMMRRKVMKCDMSESIRSTEDQYQNES